MVPRQLVAAGLAGLAAAGGDVSCELGSGNCATLARDHVLLQRIVTKSEKLEARSCQARTFDSSLGTAGGINMAQCHGDCDSDAQCAPGLKCFQRAWSEPVPGCSGGVVWPNYDYCYDPLCEDPTTSTPAPGNLPQLDSSYGQYGYHHTLLPKCGGDCDQDSDCAEGLRCFQRRAWESVPGCGGYGIRNFDYCYDPQDAAHGPLPSPTSTSAAPVETGTTTSTETTSTKPASNETTPPETASPCLCVFDIDRTLTSKQGMASQCPGSMPVPHVWDSAYGGGYLVLSGAAVGLSQTFCGSCYLGVVSHGDVGGEGSAERDYFAQNVLVSPPHNALRAQNPQASAWSRRRSFGSPFVLKHDDRKKQEAVVGILGWYAANGITVSPDKVHFFGDRTENIGPFGASGFNSREISCASRDWSIEHGMVGLCGATLDEIVDTPGVATCNSVVG
eukprot:gb/GFBE01077144.1/.p1 GENE.gb/GFBE01077144.1/~~gb/GFBE01077144.1/.p1  ORF type:complete len:447 (+),score=62.13 gb/GFBE01077144.1/:1-1341(+)